MKQELTFKSQARIIRTLGDRLISGEVAAIIELVKNAYDADAKTCHIEINPSKDSLVIEDDGQGMSLLDVQTKWAELGTDNKFRNTVTKSGRSVLGNKGIGRLAAAKLGRYIKIQSTTEHNRDLNSIIVDGLDWDAFSETENTYIDDIKFYVEEISGGESAGTKLIITGLNQDWDKDKLEILVRELRKLISPISQSDNDFDIFLNLDAFTQTTCGFDGSELINGQQTLFSLIDEAQNKVRNKIESFPLLDACDYTFGAKYSSNKIQGILKINNAKIEHSIEVSVGDDVNLGEGLIQLNIFDRDADSLQNTFVKAGVISKEDKKSLKLQDARRLIDELSGIAIYRNEFRVRPYGDKDSDWLNLAERRVQNPSKCLEQKQVSGLIVVDTPENSGLLERSSREGFEHNNNYNAFKSLLLKALHEIETLRFAHNSRTGKNRKEPNAAVKSAFSSLRDKADLTNIEKFSDEFSNEKKKEFKAAVTEYKTSLDKLIGIIQERQSILEARSTLGFILTEVIHEAKHPTSAVGSNLISLSKRVKNKWSEDISKPVSEELLENFTADIDHIGRLEDLLKRLDPLINVRRKKSYEFYVYEAIKKSILLYQERADRAGILIEHIEPEDDYQMTGLEVDLSTAIINLIDNSIYWHEQRQTTQPLLKIYYTNDSDALHIHIEDNAGGVSEKYQDAIFNVGFTTKEEGAGLGLSIAREALGRAGAYITHTNTDNEAGSIFNINVRKDI